MEKYEKRREGARKFYNEMKKNGLWRNHVEKGKSRIPAIHPRRGFDFEICEICGEESFFIERPAPAHADVSVGRCFLCEFGRTEEEVNFFLENNQMMREMWNAEKEK